MRLGVTLFLCLGFAGCAGTGFVPMDKDTYMVARKSMQIGFGPPLGSKAAVYREANKFCAKQNKQVETVEFTMRNPRFASPGSVCLQFRCVSGDGSTSKQ